MRTDKLNLRYLIGAVCLAAALLLGVSAMPVQAATAAKYTTITAGNYNLTNYAAGKVLDIYGSTTASTNKSNVQVYTKASGNKSQQFKIQLNSTGMYSIIPLSNTKLAVNPFADKPVSGTNVNVYTLNTADKSQCWYFEKLSNGYYVVRSAYNTNLVLTANGTSNTSNVCVKTYVSGNKYQMWKLTSLSAVAPTAVTLQYTRQAMVVNSCLTLTATVAPSTATNKTVIWSSSDTSIASVSSAGKVTALKTGIVTITAKTSNGKTASCVINIEKSTAYAAKNLYLNRTSVTLFPGQTYKLECSYKSGLTWRSSNTAVATVSGGTITPIANGTTTITCKTSTGSASCVITVSNSKRISMVSYNQCYSGWASKTMGTDDPNATIGKYGCLCTCLAELETKYQGVTYTPYTISKKLKFSQGYLLSCTIWDSYVKTTNSWTNYFNQLRKGKPVLLEVTKGSSTHWVVVVGYKNVSYKNGAAVLSAKNFIIIDSGGYSANASSVKTGKTRTVYDYTSRGWTCKLVKVKKS